MERRTSLAVEGVEVGMLLRELPDGQVKVSLRSRGRVDVAAVAQAFGGGGHRNAAGCTLSGPLAAARDRVLETLQAALPGPRQPAGRETSPEVTPGS